MNEGRRLKSVVEPLLTHVVPSQLAQFSMHSFRPTSPGETGPSLATTTSTFICVAFTPKGRKAWSYMFATVRLNSRTRAAKHSAAI